MSETTPPLTSQAPQAQQMQVNVRDDKAHPFFSNMSRVSMGPQAEEVILELGVMQHDARGGEALNMEISARVFMSVYAAKKLALTLSQAIQRYEGQFGPVELDVRRRLKSQA